MSIRDWLNEKKNGNGAKPHENLPLHLREGLRIPDSQMSEMERQVFSRIEDRYRRRAHMQLEGRDVSKEDEQGAKVSRAMDGLINTLKAREQGRVEEWEKLEANIDKAINVVRQELRAQRRCMERAKGAEHITRRQPASWER